MTMHSTKVQKIVIVGGGGFGRELLGYLQSDINSRTLMDGLIAGVVDNDPKCEVMRCYGDVPYLGRVEDMQASGDCRFLVAIGVPALRRKVANELVDMGLELFTYIHPSVYLAKDAIVGAGTIVGPGSVVNSGAEVGECCAINVLCSIGHGTVIGDYSVLSPYCAMNGNSRIGNSCILGTRATIFPGISIGDNCKVDTHSFVKASIGDGMIVSNRSRYLAVKNRLET